jgi:hypothetical protein
MVRSTTRTDDPSASTAPASATAARGTGRSPLHPCPPCNCCLYGASGNSHHR